MAPPKKINKIVSDNGSVIEVDVSTPIHKNKIMLIDKDDWCCVIKKINGGIWVDEGRYTFYARSRIGVKKSKAIHQIILPEANCIDHINGNGLDNRRSNIRSCSIAQNNINHKVRTDNTSGTTGVFWSKKHKQWRSQIKLNGKMIHLGLFKDKLNAVTTRKLAEKEYYGEFAQN